ncbi:lyase family protein, partial [uncultured Anaerococcus sp.]|uniref:class II fumarate hydratase n=1 Tax=uncultured Anaerococcus sp. TaxID=293428 RepID=UPI00262FB4E8
MDYRIEKDSMGEVKVREDKLWAAQTQRSFENFPQGVATMPDEQIKSLVLVKKAAALVNNDQDKLEDTYKDAIVEACDKVLAGGYEDQFPLTVYQTGSGTQTNMNVNEVIAHLANDILGEKLIHPNDHVNMSQSTNDSFPTAMHLTSLRLIKDNLLPEVEKIYEEFYKKAKEVEGIIKTGRTHLQDATPLSLSDEIKTYGDMIKRDGDYIKESAKTLQNLAIGGTAVGTGLNTKEGYDKKMAEVLSDLTGLKLRADDNKFLQLSSKQGLAKTHGAIKILASDLLKIAEDIRFLSSGPRTGIGELTIPSNEPGSSIMPGKVNPTQVEMLTMISLEVMANDQAITMANALGQLELNAYMPLIIYKMVESIKILTKGIHSFNEHLVKGLVANENKIGENLEKSLMLVTALSPHIGYDKASRMAKFAHKEGLSLREANAKLGFVTEDEFDQIVDP